MHSSQDQPNSAYCSRICLCLASQLARSAKRSRWKEPFGRVTPSDHSPGAAICADANDELPVPSGGGGGLVIGGAICAGLCGAHGIIFDGACGTGRAFDGA